MIRQKFHQTRRAILGATLLGGFAAALPALAQERWPSRTVTVVSPYNPGGTNDIVARLLAERLQKALGQAFVVDNRPGAAGVIGVQSVIRAKPDGYTLISGNNGALVIQSAARLPSPYDPSKQLTPIMKVADAMNFITVSGELPVKSVGELIAYAKKEPGKLNYSSAGVGSYGHFLGEYLKLKAGIDMVHVPAKGSAAALTELMAGRVHVMLDPLPLTQASDPRVRVLATLSPQRLEAYPQYPTMTESGGPELELSGWFGLHGPAGLPPEIVARIVEVGRSLQNDAEARKIFSNAGLILSVSAGQPFADLVRSDLNKVADIRNRAKIQIE